MRIAVLALQGAFAEHRQKLAQLGVDSFEVRQLKDWDQPKDGLIIPGGESTTQAKLLNELGLMEPVKEAIAAGLPVYGTCAGLILLAKKIEGEPNHHGYYFYQNSYASYLADTVNVPGKVNVLPYGL